METNDEEDSDAEDLSKTINRLGVTVQEKTLISVQIDYDVTQ
ncbi:MAG TPA: hypothetical protein O0W88_02705 [Methanocorpusculum sp.]|nr:hypothetical protein [Methanocorpusculum sp.]